MNWKYFFAHKWSCERHTWEDIWLLPDDLKYKGDSIWLTISAIGYITPEMADWDYTQKVLEEMGNNLFLIDQKDNTEMIVNVLDFTKEELLIWVKVWLKEMGFVVMDLIEGTREEFNGRNQQSRTLNILRDSL